MHVALDIVGARISGTSAIALEAVRSAIEHKKISSITAYVTPAHDRELVLPKSPKLLTIEKPRASSSVSARVLWLLAGLHQSARRDGAQVILGLGNGVVSLRRPPAAVYIHQALPFSHESLALMPRRFRVRMAAIREVMRVSVHSASLVVVQTGAMRDMLLDAFSIDAAKIVCITPSAPSFDAPAIGDPSIRAVRELPRGARFAYISGDLPYKNVRTLLDAFARVQAARPDAKLVTVLPRHHSAASDAVLCLGTLNRAQLAAVYSEADAVVMPSIVESLGLPLLEAMQFGKPIVTVDRPYAHDACGDAAVYVNPYDAQAMADAMRSVIEDDALKKTLSARGLALHDARKTSRPFERMWDAVLDTAR
ncbi:MAG: glycosyltransferase family 4 protein [Clostridia bacterium]|nr:glycosyltransferase family 4 protein [Deltaproteobacteria bacterium]